MLNKTNNNISKNIEYITFHKAGHAVANILIGSKFKVVTIKEDSERDEYGQRSLGRHIQYENRRTKEQWDKNSNLSPNEFDVYFKDD